MTSPASCMRRRDFETVEWSRPTLSSSSDWVWPSLSKELHQQQFLTGMQLHIAEHGGGAPRWARASGKMA